MRLAAGSWLISVMTTFSGGEADASASDFCDRAARAAAAKTGVPLDVLLAITRSETGRKIEGKLSPWPWTVNMEGVGKWFATRAEALSYVQAHHATGARSFDIGCFQVNYRWHGTHFASIDEMFDPEANALYAARFLGSLRHDQADWSAAAGAYHSRTPKHAERYRDRFDDILAALPSGADRAFSVAARAEGKASSKKANAYPFLKPAASEPRFGSLVPLGEQSAALSLFAGREVLR